MSRDGIIRAAKPESDKEKPAVTVSTVAAAANIIQEEIRPEQYDHLRGQKIRLMEASRQYGVDEGTLRNWIRYGYIKPLVHNTLHVEIDKAQGAYITSVFKRATELTGSSIRAGWVLKRLVS
jgi:hypothetical protein